MSWLTLQDEAEDLASFGARRLTDHRVAYLATVDATGAPRVHPVTPIVAPGGLFVFMEATSPKGHDLERGSRYALHCAVEDDEGGGGEFRIRGSARRVVDAEQRALVAEHAPYTPTDEYVLFELLVDDAFSTVYADDGTPDRRRWRAAATG
jgi:pyridoxine/pyridoxamine 5'-phosphate oxidase